jgi:drug/metabolite transporter (DMT)-like permease
MKIIYSIIISVLMVVTGQTLLKQGLSSVSLDLNNFSSIFNVIYEPLVLGGLILIASSSIIWLSILSKTEISYAYPMISLGYVVVALISLFYFNENVSAIRWAGIFTICFGVFLMSRS